MLAPALLLLALSAQPLPPEDRVGPHAAQAAQFEGTSIAPPGLPYRAAVPHAAQLSKRVYGYLPTWSIAPSQVRWDAVTDLIVFSGTVSSSTGALSGIPATWNSGGAAGSGVTTAHANGARAHLCITLFSNVGTFLSSSTATSAAVTNMVNAVQAVGGDGIDIDFEFVTSGYKAQFTSFIQSLAGAMHSAIPGSEVTIAMPAYPPWYPGYDVTALAAAADRLLIMLYDWHYGGGSTAGPVAPLTGSDPSVTYTWSPQDETAMQSFLSLAPAGKLAFGVPYYGYDWATSSETAIPASTTATGTAVVYHNAVNNAATYGRQWDPASQTPWYHYASSGTPHQCWYDDDQSLGLKYDYVNSIGVAGIMIWALGYEGTSGTLPDLIIQKFGIAQPDGGAPDAGATADAGSTADAGATADAGSTADAGTSADAGSAADAGAACPNGCPSGQYCDPVHRVCMPTNLSGSKPKGGCGCGYGSLSALALLGALAAVRRRRAA